MNITLKLEGFPEEIINEMLARKIATNKTEAIRVAIMDYNEHHRLKDLHYEAAVKKMQELDKEIRTGKRKVLTPKEALGEKYAKMLE
jgi:hypothetical protein